MRHRRAERCVIRAEVALEAGFEEDARAALDEARRLNAQSPEFETLRATVAERVASVIAARRVRRRRRASGVAAAALLCLTIGAAVFWPRSEAPAAVAEPRAAPAPDPVPTVASGPDLPASTAVPTSGEAGAIGDPAPARDAAAALEEVVARPIEVARALRPEPPVRPLATPEPAPAPAPATEFAILPVPPAPVLADTRTVAAVNAPSTLPLDRIAESLPIAKAPEASTPPASAGEEPRVRAALARYESAYTGLNASAARAVWPDVDERALARAFEGLESQRVSLGRCSVTVQGLTAQADCSGTVSWTPKVGGGSQTQARRWRFDLASADGAWQITRAETR